MSQKHGDCYIYFAVAQILKSDWGGNYAYEKVAKQATLEKQLQAEAKTDEEKPQ